DKSLHRIGGERLVSVLPGVPEDRSFTLWRHDWIGDGQFPVLAAAITHTEERLLRIGMIREGLDKMQIVAIGIPRAQANLGVAGRRGEPHRADPAGGTPVNLPPRYARGLDK